MSATTRREAIRAAERNAGVAVIEATVTEPTIEVCGRPGCVGDSAAVVEIHDRIDGTILRRHLCALDRNALVAVFGRRRA